MAETITKLKLEIIELHIACERSNAQTLPEVNSILDECLVLDDLLDNLFEYKDNQRDKVLN